MFKDIELEENKDKELSLKEKAIVLGAYSIGRIILSKFRKVKTYGELAKLGRTIENSIDKADAEDTGDMSDPMEEARMHRFFKNITQDLK